MNFNQAVILVLFAAAAYAQFPMEEDESMQNFRLNNEEYDAEPTFERDDAYKNSFESPNKNIPPQSADKNVQPPGNIESADRNTFPRAGSTFPRAGSTFPRAGSTFPRAGSTFPRAGSTFPRAGSTFPRAGSTFPRAGSTFPRAGSTFPRAGSTFPRAGSTFPRAGSTFPRAGSTFPRAGSTFPRAGSTFPRAGSTFPRAGSTFPRAGSTFPRAGSTFPRAGSTFPRESADNDKETSLLDIDFNTNEQAVSRVPGSFSRPFYIQIADKEVFVTEYGTRNIIVLDLKGKVLIEDLVYPQEVQLVSLLRETKS